MQCARLTGSVRLFGSSAGRLANSSEGKATRKRARKGMKMSKNIELMEQKLLTPSVPPYWCQPVVVPSSPLNRTVHPKGPFEEEDEKMLASIREKSKADEPLDEADATAADPYCREKLMCVLCPRRYDLPIVPDYKNPKLLAQFVSPHTGLVYKKHITGLCDHMQKKVENETRKAQASGYLSTKIKEVHYLRDHALFNPTRPARENPY